MLRDILAKIAKRAGKTRTEEDLLARLDDINTAAKEVHDSTRLEEAMDEDIFNFNNDSAQQIAVPSFVGEVIGGRYADNRCVIDIDDIRNRYNFHWFDENEVWYLKFRFKGIRALWRSIENQSVLTFRVPLAEDEEFSVNITGETDNSFRSVETLTFAAGETEKTTVGNYKAVEAITKSVVTKYDVSVEDVEGNDMGRVLNSLLASEYNLYQIMDTEQGYTLPDNFSGVEIHYKKKFHPFKNMTDNFLGTSKYDDAIVWKYMEHRAKDPAEATSYLAKCNQVMSQMYQDDSATVKRRVDLRPSPYFNLPYKWYNYWNS